MADLAMQADLRSKILSKVGELAVRPRRIRGGATEVYYDTQLYGEDFYDLVDWLVDEFGTDFSAMNGSEYAPGEGGGIQNLLVLAGMRPFKSLTVDDLVAAVERGHWQ